MECIDQTECLDYYYICYNVHNTFMSRSLEPIQLDWQNDMEMMLPVTSTNGTVTEKKKVTTC